MGSAKDQTMAVAGSIGGAPHGASNDTIGSAAETVIDGRVDTSEQGSMTENTKATAPAHNHAMQPLLIELGTEELPVKALHGLAQAFFDGVIDGLHKRGIAFDRDGAKPLYTPRRLAVLLPGVPSGP